jgi:hypothetical protein
VEPAEPARSEGPPPPAGASSEKAGRSVALLLAASAALAALITARAALASSSGGDSYQSAVRAETKRSSALVEDVRYVYSDEAKTAFRHASRVILEDEVRKQAQAASGILGALLVAEADVHQALAETTHTGFLATDPTYADGDAYDVGAYLADVRAETPDLVAIDPQDDIADGDDASARAREGMLATIPIAVAFFAGAMAQAFPRRRRPLVTVGFGLLLAAAVAAILVEVL